MIFDVAPLPFYGDSAFLITICIVAGIVVLILIAYFAYRFIKQKKPEKLTPEDLEKKNKKSEKEEVIEEAKEEGKTENTDSEGE